jgi:hypothetical protein
VFVQLRLARTVAFARVKTERECDGMQEYRPRMDEPLTLRQTSLGRTLPATGNAEVPHLRGKPQ